MAVPTVLISGAGIAGPAAAFWFSRNGFRVVVVESAAGVRPGGQTVDLRGAGVQVIGRMGLSEPMRRRALFQRGIAWVRADGRRRAEMPVTAFDGNGPVSELEILRDDLVDMLYAATRDTVEYRFGTRIAELHPDGTGVTVALSDGTELRAALVVGADGLHSAVRRMVFGPEKRFLRRLGGYSAWFTAPDPVGLDGWYLMYQAPGGLNASLRPSREPGSAKAGLAFRAGPIDDDRHDRAAQWDLLAEQFAGAGWHCEELLLAARDAEDFYLDEFCQVHMDRWTRGRVALVGDAGYCASPLSGTGAGLALAGAYLLAGEVGPAAGCDADRLARALDAYDRRMRPYVDRCQDLPNTIDRFLPLTGKQIESNASAMKWMQRRPFRPLAARLWFRAAESIELPDYPD